MDEHRFDLLTKILGDAPTRRETLRLLTGVAGGGLAALLGVPQHEAGEAERRKKAGQKDRKQKRKRERKQERKRERRHGRNQPQHPQSPPPCDEGMKVCEGSCIPTGQCCTNADCPGEQECRKGACGAPTLYPNLRTLPVSNLSFATHPDPDKEGTYILRFANSVWNAGEGRLELESDVDPTNDQPKPIFQNLYDADGNRTERKRVARDFIFHPQHNHFHFADFAEYRLLGQDANGDFQPMKTEGSKTSYCVMDTWKKEGNAPDQYKTCNADRQGLSPGWADTYRADLYDQWVILGDQLLADGEYAVRSIADPEGLLDEGGGERETDNTAFTYFTVEGGAIQDVRTEP
jgi:hypothetical protein